MPVAGCHKSRGKYIVTGGNNTMSLREVILNALKNYGILGAKMPSYHGSHEAEVPNCLQTHE